MASLIRHGEWARVSPAAAWARARIPRALLRRQFRSLRDEWLRRVCARHCRMLVPRRTVPGQPVTRIRRYLVLAISYRNSETAGEQIRLTTSLRSLPLRFTRKIELQENTVRLDYEATNLRQSSVKFLWFAHPLLSRTRGPLASGTGGTEA